MIALTIAGSDSGGCAGIQADIKTFSALKVFGASAITAITAQNTRGVVAVHALPADIVRAQIAAVLSDLDVRAIKIGMVADAGIAEAIAQSLKGVSVPVVLDPVMVATSGDRLLDPGAEQALLEHLVPLAAIVTPNLAEAAVMLDTHEAVSEAQMIAQARALSQRGSAVLLKGGHLGDQFSTDIFAAGDGVHRLVAERVATKNTHGTGCTLSSAIAAFLAKGEDLESAVRHAKDYLSGALAAADGPTIGHGRGPVHHFHKMWRMPSLA